MNIGPEYNHLAKLWQAYSKLKQAAPITPTPLLFEVGPFLETARQSCTLQLALIYKTRWSVRCQHRHLVAEKWILVWQYLGRDHINLTRVSESLLGKFYVPWYMGDSFFVDVLIVRACRMTQLVMHRLQGPGYQASTVDRRDSPPPPTHPPPHPLLSPSSPHCCFAQSCCSHPLQAKLTASFLLG